MRILPEILLITAGLSLGFFIASGLVALVIGLGIVTRYAGITKTAGSLRFYECCCMAGALFGDLFSLGTFSFSLPSWTAGVFWLFAGIYLGSWIIALGEVVNLFSILCRRIGLTRGLPFVILCMAAGKIAGSLYYFASGFERAKKEYEQFVKEVTPKQNLFCNMAKAFIVGGLICVVGQILLHIGKTQFSLSKDDAGSWCSLILILSSVILTGLNIYQKIVTFAGCGALVPITGFANSVAAPAIEYKKEGQVFGIGAKIFTIAGPVILYGVFASWLLGFLYWLWTAAGNWF